MIDLTPDSLLSFMRKNKYEADIQGETQQVYTVLKIKGREYPIFLRIFEEGHLLQILAFIPSHLQPNEDYIKELKEGHGERSRSAQQQAIISDLARFLHLLNKELDIPGFGMDEIAGVVFYRLMLPSSKKKIDPELLSAFLKTVDQVCQMFSNPIEALSSGQMSLDEVLAKAQQIEPS